MVLMSVKINSFYSARASILQSVVFLFSAFKVQNNLRSVERSGLERKFLSLREPWAGQFEKF